MANVESPKKLPIQLGLAVACRDLGPIGKLILVRMEELELSLHLNF